MARKAASISSKAPKSEKPFLGEKGVPGIVVQPGPSIRTVRSPSGKIMEVPVGWELLPPGDPMWTRRVKARTDHWLVQEKVGRKLFSKGLWASSEVISAVKREIDAERSKASYTAKLEKAAERRAEQQSDYVLEFEAEVARFLKFAPQYARLEQQMATAIAAHATPVGSGTVARTQRIPVEQRAESAVIAWMRHQTTAYDNMKISRERGARREVRRELAAKSRFLLDRYRSGKPVMEDCPLQEAIGKLNRETPPRENLLPSERPHLAVRAPSESPIASKPTTAKPTTAKPATAEPIAAKPIGAKPVVSRAENVMSRKIREPAQK